MTVQINKQRLLLRINNPSHRRLLILALQAPGSRPARYIFVRGPWAVLYSFGRVSSTRSTGRCSSIGNRACMYATIHFPWTADFSALEREKELVSLYPGWIYFCKLRKKFLNFWGRRLFTLDNMCLIHLSERM